MMAALFACLISLFKGHRRLTFEHPSGLPLPLIMHLVLEDDFIQKFKEIFVIGDVHGCYDEMETLLRKANVLNDTSLKIFVGDLVNKGPKNLEVLHRLVSLPSTLSVRGNHDEIVLQEYFKSLHGGYQFREKNEWIKELSSDYVNYLCQLPYSISIPSLKAIIVHAGLVPGIPLQYNNLTDIVTMRNLIMNDHFGEGGIQATKKDTEGEPWAPLWQGSDHIYFGHDAKRHLQKYKFATGLDTGCVYGKQLTGVFISGPRKGSFIHVDASKVYCLPKSGKS